MPLSDNNLEAIENRAREQSAEYLNMYDPNGVLGVTQECQDVFDPIRELRLIRKSRNNLKKRLGKAVSQLIAAGNLLMFLSDHLEGRMDTVEGQRVFGIPPGWFAAHNAWWPEDSVEKWYPLSCLEELKKLQADMEYLRSQMCGSICHGDDDACFYRGGDEWNPCPQATEADKKEFLASYHSEDA